MGIFGSKQNVCLKQQEYTAILIMQMGTSIFTKEIYKKKKKQMFIVFKMFKTRVKIQDFKTLKLQMMLKYNQLQIF